MDKDTKDFLVRILQSISLVLLWMMLNTFFGIQKGLLFLDEGVTKWHIIYYVFLVGSAVAIFIYLYKKWKQAPRFDRESGTWHNS